MDQPVDVQFRNVTYDEVRLVHSMETESFPEGVAEGYDIFTYRQSEAPDLFLGCYIEECIVGFICATRHHSKELIDDCMKVHIPDGESVCIHSVVVKKEHRRKGIALKMLNAFVDKVKKEQHGVSRILLMTKSDLIPWYQGAGFTLNGRANMELGKNTWYEMHILLPDC